MLKRLLPWHWSRRSRHFVLAAILVMALSWSVNAQPVPTKLPVPHPHPLPVPLAQWQAPEAGDYFDQVQSTSIGYLVWSQFPVTVYIQPPTIQEDNLPFTAKRARDWVNAITQAVQEWHRYLPLKIVDQADGADITIWRSPPPLRVDRSTTRSNDPSGESRPAIPIVRARSAETRFELYWKHGTASSPSLAHRFTIHLRPDQAPPYLLAAARHELGHALGIWGHSPQQTDALYFAQVRNPPPISRRDINTLKRIYAQPTRLGWRLPP